MMKNEISNFSSITPYTTNLSQKSNMSCNVYSHKIIQNSIVSSTNFSRSYSSVPNSHSIAVDQPSNLFDENYHLLSIFMLLIFLHPINPSLKAVHYQTNDSHWQLFYHHVYHRLLESLIHSIVRFIYQLKK